MRAVPELACARACALVCALALFMISRPQKDTQTQMGERPTCEMAMSMKEIGREVIKSNQKRCRPENSRLPYKHTGVTQGAFGHRKQQGRREGE